MEPADLNSPSDTLHRQLGALFANHANAVSLPDDGFSNRVLAALPPSRRSFLGLLAREWIAGLAAGAGVLVWSEVHGTGPAWSFAAVVASFDDLVTAIVTALENPGLLLGVGIVAACLYFASPDTEPLAGP